MQWAVRRPVGGGEKFGSTTKPLQSFGYEHVSASPASDSA